MIGIKKTDEKIKLYLASSYECNNNCLFCVVDSSERKKVSMSTEEVIGFLKGLEETGEINQIKFIELSGGEPTIRNDLFYIMDYIRYNHPHIRFGLLSNGRRFSNEYFTEKLSEYNIDWIFVPIHGHTAKLHDMQTQSPGSFNETLLGVHNLFQYGIRTSLKTVVTAFNYKHIPDIVEFVATTYPDCKIFTVSGIDIYGAAVRNKDAVRVRFSDAVQYIQKGIDVANKYGLIIDSFNIPPCIFEKKYRASVCMQYKDLRILKTPDLELRNIEYQYGTLDNCHGCLREKNCSGGWFSYLKDADANELKPIRAE